MKVELERDPGVLDYSRTVVLNRRTAFVVDCIMTKHNRRGRAGCEQVLGSFQFAL